MSQPTDSRDAEDRALSNLLRGQLPDEPSPEVHVALQQRLRAETRDSRVGYVVVQGVLLAALVVAGWYVLR